MQQHVDILDERDSLGSPFVQSVLLHAAVAGALIISSIQFQHSRQVWGSTNTGAGTAVAVNSVKTIPLPSRAGQINPVANDTESQVLQPPKPEPKKQVKEPDADAIPLKSRLAKKQPKPEASQKWHPKLIPENQVFSRIAPAASSIVVITFDIQRDGSVRNAKVAQRSGDANLDYSALRAVTDAAPFPPLP